MFCTNCGNNLNDGQVFCPECGAKQNTPNQPVQATQPIQQTPQFQTTPMPQPYQNPTPPTNILFLILGLGATFFLLVLTLVVFLVTKTSIIGMIISLFVILIFMVLHIIFSRKSILPAIALSVAPLILVSGVFGVSLIFGGSDNGPNITIGGDTSSLVSKGVNTNDLGNIMNGQYFFDDGTYQFYSSFDQYGAAHIYRTEKSTGNTTIIFDGFGWSFSVYEDWLYFSGNEGTTIDATYTLFRIKTDGTGLERLNETYCFGLNFYNEYLYYIKADNHSSTSFSLCRSQLDGSNEEILVQEANYYCIVFDDMLYYLGTEGYIYRANVDGTSPTLVITDSVDQFIIGNGKLIYLDNIGNIKTAKVDGTNIETISVTSYDSIVKINSYKDNIFYVLYGEYDSTYSGWPYTLHTIKDNGTGDRQIYNSISDGFYINVLNDKVFVLDYAYDPATTYFPAITKNMDFDGSNLTVLYR